MICCASSKAVCILANSVVAEQSPNRMETRCRSVPTPRSSNRFASVIAAKVSGAEMLFNGTSALARDEEAKFERVALGSRCDARDQRETGRGVAFGFQRR